MKPYFKPVEIHISSINDRYNLTYIMIKVEIRKASDLSFKELKEFKEINDALEYCFNFHYQLIIEKSSLDPNNTPNSKPEYDYEIVIYDHYVECFYLITFVFLSTFYFPIMQMHCSLYPCIQQRNRSL